MTYNELPEMIFFDVGGTLFDDGRCIPRDGLVAVREVALNSEVTDVDTMVRLWDEYMKETDTNPVSASGTNLDFPLSAVLKYVTMNSGLRFSCSVIELEEIFDRFNSSRNVLDGIPELLESLRRLGIRSAVISNNAMSGEGLTLAIDRWIPENRFEFCFTSADILLPKPHGAIFRAAANYAGVATEKCMYCGDTKLPDVDGSRLAGMLPVLIDRKAEEYLKYEEDNMGEYMVINHWNALTEFLTEKKA